MTKGYLEQLLKTVCVWFWSMTDCLCICTLENPFSGTFSADTLCVYAHLRTDYQGAFGADTLMAPFGNGCPWILNAQTYMWNTIEFEIIPKDLEYSVTAYTEYDFNFNHTIILASYYHHGKQH